MQSFLPIEICGTGHFLPGVPVFSEQLDTHWNQDPGRLFACTGVRARHYVDDASQIDMAVAAAQVALSDAGMAAGDVELILSASAVPYQTLPSTAPLVMQQLGVADGQAAGFDVNSSCTSFLTAVELASRQIAAGQVSCALVVSSEIASRGLPWQTQPDVAALFGDGAAAAVLRAAPDGHRGICASLMKSFPSKYHACEIGAGGTRFDFHKEAEAFAAHSRFRMDGKALYAVTLRHLPDFIAELLDQADWRQDEVDLVVPHQASPHALAHMAAHSGFAAHKIVDVAADLGNQIAASLPTALDIARRDGRAKPGGKLLLLGTSAGVSFSGLAVQL